MDSYAAQVNSGWTVEQTATQACNAYEFSSTQPCPVYYSYKDSEYTTDYGDGTDYHHAFRASIPLSSYSSLVPPSSNDAPKRYLPSDPVRPPSGGCEPLPVEQEVCHRDALQVDPTTSPDLANDRYELLIDRRQLGYGAYTDGKDASPTPSEDVESYDRDECPAAKAAKSESLNQRKGYFRAISNNVGFTITDPDTITSHDKKRRYLESLEEYVLWLHEQLRLVGQNPIPLERVPRTHRSITNRSLRTILVHKQNTVRQLNLQKTQAEEEFMELQNAVLRRQAATDTYHSSARTIAVGTMPRSVVPNLAPYRETYQRANLNVHA